MTDLLKPSFSAGLPRIRVVGAGIVGLTIALEFARAGCAVEVAERRQAPGRGCSFYAGGMIAPWCEAETAEQIVTELGTEALTYWMKTVPVAVQAGSLVIAPARDQPDLIRFAKRTTRHRWLDRDSLDALEPDLGGRFGSALFFPAEAHLDPRAAVATLVALLAALPNVTFHYETDVRALPAAAGWTIDCRGLAARDALPDLRGVRGEMVVLRTREIDFARPIRLVHPRHPIYIVPRGDGRFMVGATMVESEAVGGVTAKSLLELLGAAYTVHPAFGEAELVETGCDLRPAFPDNLPRLRREGRTLYVNGLFRHGFLLSPALARRATAVVLSGAHFPEIMNADTRERQRA